MTRNMKFLSFWSINDGVHTERLCQQMLQMHQHGMEGVVFHPRFYPGDPNYMTPAFIKVVGEVILYAKSIGMEFWIYDENGWPSGAADGQVLKAHPDSKRWGLASLEEKDIREDNKILCRHNGKVIVARGEKGVSPLCRETTDTFLAFTHERYFKELPREAFDYVTGFFCDEVDYFPGHLFSEGAVPWCPEFESFYKEKYGISPCDELWKLFDTEDEHPEFKVRFWETAGDLIARNFYQPYQQWCERHGKLFTGHLKGEESPYFQLMFSGSCFTQLEKLSLPAIDTLERYHGNHFFPYLLSSIAAQQGRSGCLAEAMGGAGWGVAPNDLVNYMLWLAEAGVERVVLHLGQFLLKAQAIRDWPPSVPLHLSWHDAFSTVLDQIRAMAKPLLSAAWEEPKVLIVTPTRGVMASYRPILSAAINLHDGSGIPDSASARINAEFLETVERCYASGWKYHFTEERGFKNISLQNGKIHLGSMVYDKILVSRGCLFEDDEQRILDALRENDMLIDSPCKPLFTAKEERKTDTFVPIQGPWKIDFPERNQLLIEWKSSSDGVLRAQIPAENVTAPVTLVFSDPIQNLHTNATVQTDELSPTTFSLTDIDDLLTLEVTPTRLQTRPFAWLKGDFSVIAVNGWKVFDERQMSSDGNFRIVGNKNAQSLTSGELVQQGLPFYGELLTAEKTFSTDQDFVGEISFDTLLVSAAQITVDGDTVGWWWKDHPVSVKLKKGTHKLTIAAAPSTYNTYGPHHYYLGDCRLTSPDTFIGRGGYMDNADAPANTLIDTMQFVNFTIDGNIILK